MQIKEPQTPNQGQRYKRFGDELVVKRKGGGSIIDRCPLFSSDGEILYVVWKNVIRANSTKTGDFVREFEHVDNKIIAITFNYDNFNTIIGCTENGELVNWDSRNGLIIKKLKFKTHNDAKIKTFHIVNYQRANGLSSCHALLTYIVEAHNDIQLVVCDFDTGDAIKSTCIKYISDYYVDIIGNGGNNLVALGQDVDLHILRLNQNLTDTWHKIGLTGRKITCVAGHPDETCVAIGDSSGRAVLWYDLFKKHPTQGVYHWHTLPVTDIEFSKSGENLYTGGSECVLVKWTIGKPNHKSFLPRLPAPIKHISVAPENRYVAISTLDNGIIIINPEKKVESIIQNFTWGVTTSKKNLFPAGLVLDPRSGSLVLNSRTGHVQFFDTNTKSLLHNIDITTQNLLTQGRNMIIVNTEVTKIALSCDGTWMATVEERNDGVSNPEVRLKFWKYISENQTYSLNTCIESPHDNGVTSLKFRTNTSLDSDSFMVVTTGKDDQFKLWELIEPESMYKTTKYWQCCGLGDYHNLPSMDADFSIDGSLLGVGFGSSLTIWNPITNILKCSLTHSHYRQTLKRIEFGKHETCHLVVVGSSEHIAVWNLLTLTISWSVPLKLSNLTSDISSVYMVAFTEDNNLYAFTPQSSEPVYTRKNLLKDESIVMGACFVPNALEKKSDRHIWQLKSQLFFLDSNQELLTLEEESEAAVSLENLTVNGNLPLTAFSSLIADETNTNVEKDDLFLHEQFGKSGKNMVDELLTVSSHTLPPIRMLCLPFIMSLRATNSRDAELRRQISSNNDDSNNDSIAVVKNELKNENKKPQFQEEFEKNQEFISFNWKFLAEIYSDK